MNEFFKVSVNLVEIGAGWPVQYRLNLKDHLMSFHPLEDKENNILSNLILNFIYKWSILENYELVNFISAYKVALSIVDCFEV